MKEWNRNNEFNSFNSWKGLLYGKWYQAIVDWKDKKIKVPLAPIEASLDPIHACNLMCEHCNAHRYLEGDEKVANNLTRMSDNHIMDLVKYLADWGVLAVCYGGGGEPTLHTKLADALRYTKELGMESSIATNGTLFNDNLIKAMAETCRWVGVSIDASTSKTYKIGRKVDLFDKALTNIQALTEEAKQTKSKCDVAFKFLIFDYNQHEILDACKLAESIGVKDFHARPADFTHQGMGELQKRSDYDIPLILKQFEECQKLSSDDFRVFTVMHKFDENFLPKKDFTQCYGAPLTIQLCADGNVYHCVDQRHQKKYNLGNHYPNVANIAEFWGDEKHYNLTFKDTPRTCTTRCTFGRYCKQCEELFASDDDPMCWRFT